MYFEAESEMLINRIRELHSDTATLIIAIDGRCASGKTTLAGVLCEKLDCTVIHTDDFYLQPFQRTAERYADPGGNLDRERLTEEILLPLSKGEKPVYRPFVCSTMSFGEAVSVKDKSIYIIEGSYSCHKMLRQFYNLTVFVTVGAEIQQKRILERNGEEKLKVFNEKWIPLEEKYFAAFDVEQKADIVIKT